jgi:hypothetical protein
VQPRFIHAFFAASAMPVNFKRCRYRRLEPPPRKRRVPDPAILDDFLKILARSERTVAR